MIELIRFRMDQKGTFGALIIPGHGSWVTVERPWIDTDDAGKSWPYGLDQMSCVREGVYTLSKEHSNKYGKGMWHLIGEGVTYQPGARDPVEWRSNVMIHGANRASELMGCIAPGKIYDPVNSQVLKSQTALGEITMALGQLARPQIRIRNAW